MRVRLVVRFSKHKVDNSLSLFLSLSLYVCVDVAKQLRAQNRNVDIDESAITPQLIEKIWSAEDEQFTVSVSDRPPLPHNLY